MEYILIIIYFFFLLWLYVFIMKRLKNISYRHMTNTWLESLWRWYEIIRRRLIVILILMFLASSFLILTFFHNDLLFKIWLHDNQETLDGAIF